MKVIYLSFMLLNACNIGDMCRLVSSLETPDLSKKPSGLSSDQSTLHPNRQNVSLCDKTKVNEGATDTHEKCQKECMKIKSDFNASYRTHPDTTTQQFSRYCGSVTEGKCEYLHTASTTPTCSCYTPANIGTQQRIPWSICNYGFLMTHKMSSTPTGMKRLTTSARKIVGEALQVGRAHNLWRGLYPKKRGRRKFLLLANLDVSGKKIRALLDTGSCVTMVDENIAEKILPLQKEENITGIDAKPLKYIGKTQLNIQFKNGIAITITGLVRNSGHALLLGTDFFSQFFATIKIFEKNIEIFTGQTWVRIPIEFGEEDYTLFACTSDTSSLLSDPGTRTTQLKIFARVNRTNSTIIIDTGSTANAVNKGAVDLENLRPTNRIGSSLGSGLFDFLGVADVQIQIESTDVIAEAYVLPFNYKKAFWAGNVFIRQYVKIIDFKRKHVTLKLPGNKNRITTRAFFIEKNNPSNGQ